jgi:glycine dehydrogenase subunit 2
MKLIFDYDENITGHVPSESIDLELPKHLMRSDLPLPNVNEVDVVRHYTNLSRKNFGIDLGIYPLGSCTMKYNPKVNEDLARLKGFSQLHPMVPTSFSQGSLELIWKLQQYLKEITGMDEITLQPAAGSQCELLGLMMTKKYFKDKNEERKKVIIPDYSHGTNPATSSMCKFQTVTVQSDPRGNIPLNKFREVLDSDVAVVMITNPNTLGLFEENLSEISDLARSNGTLLYCDGANMNALLGISKPGEQGFDMVHLNLHKTFSTPHGGGGPGGGALCVKSFLADYLPVPRIVKESDEKFSMDYDKKKSVGKVHSFYGNFGMLLRAYSYIMSWGSNISRVSKNALLNANYLQSLLSDVFEQPYNRKCAHEFVLSSKNLGAKSAMNIAKRIMDYGLHPPTIYFPLIVEEALMIEPTETESKESLDNFASVLKKISVELVKDPDFVMKSPHTTKLGRLDEVKAAREPNLRWLPKVKV